MKNLLKLIVCIAICQLAGVIGSIFTMDNISTWYPTLTKPPLQPPNWIFGPVWITLYVLMGISLFLVIKKGFDAPGVKSATGLFAAQLILNALWSIVFFGMHELLFSIVIIAALWLLILLTMLKFKPISLTAAVLLLPYLLWVSFASYLNSAIYVLNK
ncbi:MAG: tryptophan-rich sensory protein [Ignavibacteria bacterium]|nr:tryptophan-rich sensory protein [Ignavibacteria bacterium]